MEVTLREINRSNWKECIKLNPGKDQENFVASNTYSLAQAAYEPNFYPLAIYAGEAVVGFVMYGYDPEDNSWGISRLMIDEKEQGKGYGRAALRQVVKLMAEKPGTSQVYISWVPENIKGEKLYLSEGFIKTGDHVHGEVIGRLDLK